VSDLDAWSDFAFKVRPFIKAFKDGLCRLLDEVDLAPQLVSQCSIPLPTRNRDLIHDTNAVSRTVSLAFTELVSFLRQNVCYPGKILNCGSSLLSQLPLDDPRKEQLVEIIAGIQKEVS
jgi:hypothetical protein